MAMGLMEADPSEIGGFYERAKTYCDYCFGCSVGDSFPPLARVRARPSKSNTWEVPRRTCLCSIEGSHPQWRCDLYFTKRFSQAHRRHLDTWMGGGNFYQPTYVN